MNEYSRMEALLGIGKTKHLSCAKVAVFGLGGVGSYVVEGLARCGIGSLTLVDHDTVSITNINRQLFALHSTLGESKTEVARARVYDIDPEILVNVYEIFYCAETESMFHLSEYDYIVDATDTVTSKLLLIENAKKCNVPVISCMGTGNKLDASRFEIADISKTSVCPLAKVIRTELRKRGIKKVKVLYSKELPQKKPKVAVEKKGSTERPAPGSISFVPSVAGLLIAGEVVRDLTREGKSEYKRNSKTEL